MITKAYTIFFTKTDIIVFKKAYASTCNCTLYLPSNIFDYYGKLYLVCHYYETERQFIANKINE